MSNDIVHAKAVMAVPMNGGQEQGYGGEESTQNNYNQQGELDSYHGDGHGGLPGSMADQIAMMQMEQNVYDMGENNGEQQQPGADGNWADDTIERSGNLFNQLDSMIAAVQTESSALDKMREKLRELDGMRVQLSSLTKKLLDADHANLALKGNLVKIQEAYAEARRAKQELESTLVPLRQDLNKHKDLYNRERNARLSAQQESTMLKDQLVRLEKVNEELERDVKAIPTLQEQNDMLRNDLNRLRQRYKEENEMLGNQNQHLLRQVKMFEDTRGELRNLAVRMLDLASQGGGGGGQAQAQVQVQVPTQAQGQAQGQGRRNPPHISAIQWEQQQGMQQQGMQQHHHQQQHQQHQQHQQQQHMMAGSQSLGHLPDSGTYQHTAQPQALQNASAVNDGRGGPYDGQQQYMQETLEEHMLGEGGYHDPNPNPNPSLGHGGQYSFTPNAGSNAGLNGNPGGGYISQLGGSPNSLGGHSQVSMLSMKSPGSVGMRREGDGDHVMLDSATKSHGKGHSENHPN